MSASLVEELSRRAKELSSDERVQLAEEILATVHEADEAVSQLAKGIPESIRAEIKAGNIASIRIAEEAGMVFEREEKGVLHYQRDAVAQPGSQPDAAR